LLKTIILAPKVVKELAAYKQRLKENKA